MVPAARYCPVTAHIRHTGESDRLGATLDPRGSGICTTSDQDLVAICGSRRERIPGHTPRVYADTSGVWEVVDYKDCTIDQPTFFSSSYISAMSQQLTVFDPFDLTIGARFNEPVLVQNTINYCGQRFRAIYKYMRNRYQDRDIPIWFNKTMESELVCPVPLHDRRKAELQ